MYSPILFTIFVVSATAWETVPAGHQLDWNTSDLDVGIPDQDAAIPDQDVAIPDQDVGIPDHYLEPAFYQYLHQNAHRRQTRQLQGSAFLNSDKTSGFNAKLPFVGNDNNVLSAIAAANLDANRHLQSTTAGLAFDNVKGHGLSLSNTHIPHFGDRITAAGHANLFHNPSHDVSANAFLARNMPSNPQIPNFSTYGGGLDYMYKDRVGASLGVSHTPFQQRTDYSANGNLNLFKGASSSLDFNAGLSKSVSPFMRSSSWEPTTGFTFRKFF